MGLFNRFFGDSDKSEKLGEQLIANPSKDKKVSLQLLFANPLILDAQKLKDALRSLDREFSRAACEIDPETAAQGTPLGLVGWSNHVIQVLGFNAPMPTEAVESCLKPSLYEEAVKDQARQHQAHVILFYAGYENSILEQYVALAAVAAALASFGGIMILNESARSCFPAGPLTKSHDSPLPELLRTLPLLILYCGFVKYNVEGTDGVWMRTYGCHLFKIPDLATLASGHDQSTAIFEIFSNVLDYLLNKGAVFAAGHTMQVGENEFMRLRLPTKEEYFLDSPGELFVAEIISGNEINR